MAGTEGTPLGAGSLVGATGAPESAATALTVAVADGTTTLAESSTGNSADGGEGNNVAVSPGPATSDGAALATDRPLESGGLGLGLSMKASTAQSESEVATTSSVPTKNASRRFEGRALS